MPHGFRLWVGSIHKNVHINSNNGHYQLLNDSHFTLGLHEKNDSHFTFGLHKGNGSHFTFGLHKKNDSQWFCGIHQLHGFRRFLLDFTSMVTRMLFWV